MSASPVHEVSVVTGFGDGPVLFCDGCGSMLCHVEAGDSAEVLAEVVADHVAAVAR